MTINGNVKFFKKNNIDSDATFTLTTALTANAKYLYDNNRSRKLISIGSSDGTDEIWQIDFATTKTIDRLYVDNHSLKDADIKYWDGGAYVDFSTPVSWTNNTTSSGSYFEFDSVSTTSIQVSAVNTIDGGEKYIGQLIATEEIGTMEANPTEWAFEFDESSINHINALAGSVYVFFDSKYIASMNFSDANDADVAILQSLKDLGDPFYIFPCGGITTHTQIGFRLQDIFLVNYINNFKPQLKENLLGIGTVIQVDFREV